MADIQANIGIGVDTTQALASIRQLQREISVFHTLMAKGGAKAAVESRNLQQNLVNSINETGRFSAGMTRISSSTESFTNALEKNKLSMGQYFRYAGGASKSFGKMFSREFNTISQVASERVKDLQTQYISMGRDANGALQSIKVRPLALDMDNLGTKVQLAAQKQQLFNQLMKQGTTNLLNFGKNTQWAGRQLMVGFTIPLTIFGATAIREFQKIEDQVVKFKRVYGDMFNTDAETEKALENVRQLAEEFTKYGVAVEKTIGLAAKAAQMGNTGDALTAQVTQATRLAVLGGLEQQEALDTTISLTNAFGIAAEGLAGKIAFLNAAENQTILSIEDFNTAIPLSGSVVRQLGGDVEDLAVLLTAMREGGINASQAGNALKSSLGRLIAPSRNAKNTLSSFGIDVLSIVDDNAGDLMATINTLAYSLNELDPLSRAKSIEALFGKFQFARMSTLFSNIVREGSQASKVLGLTANSTAELAIIAERELKRVEESPAFKLQKEMEKLKSALAPVGAEFVKAVLPLVEFGTKILKAFNEMGEGGKQFAVTLTAIAGVVAPALLMGFGLVANGVANLLKFFQFLGSAFGMLSGKSTMLGGQTEYMTQQQLEAAAVAASLGQSHSNLTQIFTSEASAISNLVTQYRAAITAQRQLSVGQTAAGVARMPMGPRPRGFASGGIISGPGTGTSDSIAAMLSDGEAVIPAAVVKKNPDLVQQLISGNIPGYADGGMVNVLGKNISTGNVDALGRLANRLNSISTMIPGILDDFGNTLVDGGKMAASSIKTKLKELAEEQRRLIAMAEYTEAGGGSAAQTGMVGGHTGGKTQVGPQAAKELARGISPGVARSQMEASDGGTLHSEMVLGITAQENAHKGGDDELSLLTGKERAGFYRDPQNQKMAGSYLEDGGYIDLEDPVQEADFSVFTSLLADKLEAAGERAISEVEYADMVSQARSEMPDGKAKTGMERAENTYKTFNPAGPDKKRYNLPTGESIVRDPKTGELTHSTAAPGGSYQQRGGGLRPQFAAQAESAALSNVADVAESQGYDATELRNKTEQVGVDGAQGFIDGARGPKGLANGSPSKKMFQIGKDGAQGLINGAKDTFTKLKGKAVQVGQGVGDKINASPVAQRAADYLGGYDLDESTNNRAVDPERMQAIHDARGINQELYDKGYITEDMQQTTLGQAAGVTPVRVVDGQVDIGDNSIDGLANASDTASQAADEGRVQQKSVRDQRSASQEATEATNNLAAATEDKAAQDKAALKESKRQNRQAMAGKMMAGLGTLSVAAGMATQVEGPIGEIAKAVVGPLAALTGILPILVSLGPVFGGLAAVVGLSVGGFLLYNSTMNKAREESIKLADAMGTSSTAMQKFADFAGNVSSTEIMNRQRAADATPFGVQAGKTSFGESFFASGEGEEFAENIQASLLEVGRDKTLRDVYQQLGSAVSSGALSSLEAQSIAQALYGELDDSTFSLELNGKLLDLLGPNGNNLLEDPLSVNMQLIITQQENLDEIIAEGPAKYADSWETANDEIAGAIVDEGPLSWAYWSQLGNVIKTTFGFGVAQDNIKRASKLTVGYRDLLMSSQQAIDNLQVSYDKKIADALSIGDTGLADDLRQQLLDDQQEIINKQQEAFQGFREMFVENPKESVRGLKEALATIYSGDELKRATEAFDEIGSKLTDVVGEESVAELQFMLTSGTFSVDNIMSILDNFSDQPDVIKKVIRLGTDRSSGEAKQVADIISLIKDPGVQAGVLNVFDESNMEEFKQNLQAYQAAANIGSLVPFEESDFIINLLYSDPDAAYAIQSDLDRLEQQADAGPITNEFAIDLIGEEAFAAIAFMWDDLKEDDKKTALYSVITTLGVDFDSPEAESWLTNMEGFTFGGGTVGEDDDVAAAAAIAERAVSSSSFLPANEEGGDNDDSTGGASKSVDSLLKKLRDLRMATIDMKKGWEGMQEVLAKTFGGTGRGIDVFNGLSNQIRKLGVGENLIEMIVGMDPDEYAKRKNELFTFDAAGNITGTTAKLKNLSSAFNSIAIGEYVNSQQAFIENTKNQFNAMNTLVASGMSVADAYELVQDEALAAAIAMGATRAEIDEIIRITAMMKEQQKRNEKQQERINTAKAVRETNKEFENQIAIINKLSKAQGNYSDEEINAILGDSNLGEIFLDPSIDPKSLKKALENARRRADLDLKIKVSTEEGKEGLFNELAAEISDEFNRQETKLQLEVDIATKADNDIVREAQNEIAEIQYKLDDYNAELEQISWLEDDINDKYDKRSEALDNIAEANGRIAEQQKAQLGIADALSKGDIAAAARAAQELREKQAENAEKDQKEMLEKARQAELDAVRGPGGMGREDLEKTITELERRAFLIEEESLEPAQERIRLAEYNRDVQISALEVSGKTRSEWEQIASQVDLATQNTDEFALSVERALALFEYFVNDVPLDTLGLFGGQLEALKEMGINVQQQTEKKAEIVAQSVSTQGVSSEPTIIPQSNGFYSASGAPSELDVFRKYRDEDTDDLTKLYLKQYASQKGFLDKLTKGTLDTSGPMQKIIMPSGSPAGETRAQANRVSTSSGSAPATPPGPGAGVTRAMTKPEMRYVAATTQDAYTKAMMMRSIQQFSSGGKVARYAVGGKVAGYAAGGYASMGSDNVPAMLTPGEFVVRKRAVQNFGMENLEKINSGSYSDGSVYNYNLAVNVNSDSDPDKIARAVVTQIKRVDSQRIRNNKL